MGVFGAGPYDGRALGEVRPGPRDAADLAAGRYEPPCPSCGAPLEPGLVGEDAPADPRNVYATTKLAQEHLAAAWARATGGRAVSLRYHNVYGDRMPRDTPYAGVAALFRSALAEAQRTASDPSAVRETLETYPGIDETTAALVSIGSYPHAVNGVRLQRVADLMHAADMLAERVDVSAMLPQRDLSGA
jgi:dTDP-L-rhamnose 4-epimerase